MRRYLAVLTLSAGLGIAVTAATPTGRAMAQQLKPKCHDTYDAFYKKIHTPHKLDHKPSKTTLAKWRAYNDTMLRKLNFACGEIGYVYNVGLSGISSVARDGDLSSASGFGVGQLYDSEVGLEDVHLSGLIPEKGYPTYDSPKMEYSLPVGSGSSGFGGSYGGYFPTSPVPPVVTPIAPTPEPSTVVIVLSGLAGLVLLRRAV